ncbi:hypothetical protein ATANTOWER_030178 [Ataeniobius toweri]|uniref:Uncharacterized protein n=1 Tax=Ataeniobius toweri TaxID=208326 RepID=A0ABU7AIM4_9TELE|nr:hypothetical protein [Ataeniobius toweri]
MEFPSKTDLPHEKNDPSYKNNKRYENNLHSKQSSPKLPKKIRPTGPRTLIVGNAAVNGIKNFCNKKNIEVMIGTSNVVTDISENILAITEERPSLEDLIIHFGAMDDIQYRPKVWTHLLIQRVVFIFMTMNIVASH